MAVSWALRPAATTAAVGRSFSSSGGTNTYGNSRWYLRFDTSGFAGSSANYAPHTNSGVITRTETVPGGTPPDMGTP